MNLRTLALKLSPRQVNLLRKAVKARAARAKKIALLRTKREPIARQLEAIDRRIAKLEGRNLRRRRRASARQGRRTGGRRGPTILQRALKVLSHAPEGVRIRDLAAAIRRAGHRTASAPRTFAIAVGQAIKRDGRIKRLAKGLYGLRGGGEKSA